MTHVPWWRDSTLYIALVLAGFTVAFGTRHLDTSERHEGLVAAIAAESVVKLVAFLAVGIFVCWGLFDGPGDIFARAAARADLKPLLGLGGGGGFAGGQWFAHDAAGHAVGDLPAAPVPGDGGRERRRAPPHARHLGLSPVPAADQPVRAADRAGRAAALRQGRRRRRNVRAVAAARAGPAAAGAGRLHRRAVGSHRHGDRRGDRSLHHGQQRSVDAAGAAAAPPQRGRSERAAAGAAANRHRRAVAAGLPVFPHRRRGLRAGQHRVDQLRRGRAVRAGAARRHVLEGRYPCRRAGRPGQRIRAVDLDAAAAIDRQVGLACDRVHDGRTLWHRAAAPRAAVRS